MFEYAVPEEGITIQVKVTKGKLILYGSHDNPDPNQVWHDYMLSNINGDRKLIILPPNGIDESTQDQPTVPFYCNLVGMEDSKFSIKAVNGTG